MSRDLSHGDDRWLLRARELLRQQARAEDAELDRRLGRIRQRALAAAGPRRPRPALLALAGAAAALALMVGVLRPGMPPGSLRLPAATEALRASSPIEQALTLPEEELDLLSGEVEYGLVEELEFYAWLEKQADAR
ncbi:MAG: hypothetical protein KatS3mg126_0795 [Lysobacteraceae bacterium]|nr:MAG: hypothetical protein KatS3mg126_0795 [Xanthomonadaceae bacterium]